MIQFSSEVIEYAQDQSIQNLVVTNKGQVQILFKVRTNNIKAIDARPNTGSISRNGNTKIIIKRNQALSDNVKLQFTYLQCNEALNKDNFKQLWAKYEKNQQSRTFSIKVASSKIQQKKDKKQNQKFQSILLTNSQSDPSMFQSVRVSKIQVSQQHQQQLQQSPGQKMKKQKQQTTQLQKNLQQKRVQNKLLVKYLLTQQKRLSQTQENINITNKNKQLQVQKYLHGPKCKRMHISPTLLGIIAAVFLVLGYYLGHSDHHHDHDHDHGHDNDQHHNHSHKEQTSQPHVEGKNEEQ